MITVFGASDVGRRRSSNQDCFSIVNLSDGSVCAVVCDGMGGAAGGNIASTLARDTVINQISASYNEKMNDRSIKAMLESAVAAANIAVFVFALLVYKRINTNLFPFFMQSVCRPR